MSSTRSSARSSSRLARRSANGSSTLMRAATTLWRLGSATALALACAAMPLQAQAQMPAPAAAQAGGNAIESVTAHQQGSNVIVKIALSHAPDKLPIGFAITNPPRIALDFGTTSNATGKNTEDMNLGELRSVNLVQAGERSRLVFNLKLSLNYATAIDGNAVILTIDGSGGLAQAVDGNGLPAAVAAAPAAPAIAAAPPGAGPSAAAGRPLLRDMDFRRGSAGEGRIVVDLPNSQVAVDVRQTGTGVVVDFLNTGLPETLRRRLDVTDFGTPVALVTTAPQGQNVRMNIEARGLGAERLPERDPAGDRHQADQGGPQQADPGHPGLPRREAVVQLPERRGARRAAGHRRHLGPEHHHQRQRQRQPDLAAERGAVGPGARRGAAGQGPGHAQERQRAADRAQGRTAEQGKAGAGAARPDRRPRTAEVGNLPAQLPEGRVLPHRVRPRRRQRRRQEPRAVQAR